MNTKHIRLCEVRGATSIFIDAEITTEGDLMVSGQDVGEAPRAFWGDSDYEYWLRIPRVEKDRLLLALLAEHYGGDTQLVSKLRDLLTAHQVPHTFDTWV